MNHTTIIRRPDDITDEMLIKVDEIIARRRGTQGSLIPVLQETQEVCGYLPVFIQEYIATGIGIPGSAVFGVVTFYSFFTMVPRGRHTVRVCMGTACFVKGANETLNRIQHEYNVEVGKTTEDRRFTIEAVRCLGACGLAPMTVIDDDTHRGMTSNKIIDVMNGYE
ncbi:MAG: NAD(P)H-dependent oxidoreductase subunit E [Deltaproteobacteria bacterium]|nr:NAD(P)H-dependent oxidoreductase subunit E [Deltaproteobacteria bacterium]MBW2050624.1 NAD(P)H-dependent oxidoreductase subunit E [Deltaproteobacteria bacterium]MBW2139482.1 NAD(P)H-dependent oxidoreductase subunit E [Deltaproteobacteria bacterium]MBW2322569.1 NAD(P)H-dependent oxidoreductase subunit E [Deltaproteobacteria bacterium]